MLACWLAASANMLLSVYLLGSGLYKQYPAAAIQGLWMPMAQGPFLYLYIKYQTRPILFQKRDLLHFLPFALGYLLFSQFYFLPFDEKVNTLSNNAAGFEMENRFRIILICISGIIYIPWSCYKLLGFRNRLEHQFSNTEKINFRWLLYLIIGMAVIWVAVLVMHSDRLVFSASAIFVCWMGYFGIKQVNVFSQKNIESAVFAGYEAATEDTGEDQPPVTQPAQPKYAKSLLEEGAAQKLHQKLLAVMEEEKPYLDPELTLNDLAGMVDTNPNLLSQVINSVEQKTFYELVNEFRVKEFLRQAALPANKKYTLLTIAYDCGFNSKASFNRNFKKHTGKSPSEYLHTM
ncbi:helix-turn-helix domain-containing protein [Chitinophaga sp. YIM B06452]|uniref:helix-turn-helix domain-containing protein n=1 Tax=Chitinophaga sp. YIM B06452 TaxID=3082158 RepID=UPI0031FEFAEF